MPRLLSSGRAMITVLIIAGLMVLTNPTTTEYTDFLKNEMKKNFAGDPLAGFAADLLGGTVLKAGTVRHNYLLFSKYETSFDQETSLTVLGVFNTFVVLSAKGD